MAVIGADDLRKRYGDTVALRGVSVAVDRGGVFALIGPNGAGKTTLIRCLTGTATPDAGTASILGGAPANVDRARIGVLPQAFDPPARLTPRELIRYYAGLYPTARGVESVLEDVGVADAADAWYTDLSGGQKRRTLVGTAVVNDPDVLFLDEPTTGIDPAGRRAVWSLITDLTTAGTTVFLTTHDMAEAERLADHVGVLVDGQIVAEGSPQDLVAEHGGPPRLVVGTDGPVEVDLAFPVDRTEEGIEIHDVSPTEIQAVVGALERNGVEYDSLVWRAPDLETVYLALAGEAPREQGGTLPRVGEVP